MGCVGCTSCGTDKSHGKVGGCNSNGCGSGGCNRLNTFDWLSFMEIPDVEEFHIVEVSFKNVIQLLLVILYVMVGICICLKPIVLPFYHLPTF